MSNNITDENLIKLRSVISKITDDNPFYNGTYSSIINTFKVNLEPLINVQKEISSIFNDLEINKITEEEIKKYSKKYARYGKAGWTMLPSLNYRLDNLKTNDIKYFDKYAYNLLKKEGEFEYVIKSCEIEKKNRTIFNEANKCYEEGKYRSCALLLFSLIDYKMTRFQKQRKCQNIYIGKNAINYIRQKKYKQINKYFFTSCSLSAIFSCLDVMYSSSNNFKERKYVINRNYLVHGYWKQKVRKVDCIKIYLLLWNISNTLFK